MRPAPGSASPLLPRNRWAGGLPVNLTSPRRRRPRVQRPAGRMEGDDAPLAAPGHPTRPHSQSGLRCFRCGFGCLPPTACWVLKQEFTGPSEPPNDLQLSVPKKAPLTPHLKNFASSKWPNFCINILTNIPCLYVYLLNFK